MPVTPMDTQPDAGIFSPTAAENTQRPANLRRERMTGLGYRADDARVAVFVTLPLPHGAKTRRLNCYPSPHGRLCTDLCESSIFFSYASDLCCVRPARSAADQGRTRGVGFDAARELPLDSGQIEPETPQGRYTCDSVSSRSWQVLGCWALRPAAKACPSRRFWAPVPGRAQRRCSTVASARARLWARRAMSPIARPIRAAAADPRGFAPRARRQTNCFKAIGASCAGGFFDVTPKGGRTGRRDDRCSRKS